MTQPSEYPLALPEGAELVGDYVITRTLGAGGFGITYQAKERSLDRLVAIKEFFPIDIVERDGWALVKPRSTQHSAKYARGLSRFIDEARTITQFNHPNIVKVLRYFKANNTAFMVLTYEQGLDFDHWQQRLGRRPSEQELQAIVVPLLGALETIHRADFLHRDIAPDNIIIRDDGSPVLIDFGSARSDLTFSEKTVSALVKSGYSPFEQYAKTSKEQGPWTDIYSFAATLYQAVTGVAPPDSLSRLAHDDLVPAAKLARKHYDEPFLAAIDRALAIRIDDRPQSVAQWRAMLYPPQAPAAAPTIPGTPAEPPAGAAAGASAARAARPKRRSARFAPAAVAVKLGKLGAAARDGLRDLVPRRQPDAVLHGVAAGTDARPAPRSLASRLDELEQRRALEADTGPDPAAIAAQMAADELRAAVAAKAEAKALARAQRAAAKQEKQRLRAEQAETARRLKAEKAEARAKQKAEQAAERAREPRRGWLHALPGWLNPGMMIGILLIALVAGGVGIFGARIRNVVENVPLPRLVATNGQLPTAGTAHLARTIPAHDGGVAHLHLASDGKALVSVGPRGEVKLWQPQSGDLLSTFDLKADQPTAFDIRGDVVALGDERGYVALHDLGKPDSAVTRFQAVESPVRSLAFAGDGYDFILGSDDGRLQYWAYKDGAYTRADFRGRNHTGSVTALAGNDRYLISAGTDTTARMWGRTRRSLIRTYRGHDGTIATIALSPDGRRIATAGEDATVRIWSNAGARVRRLLKRHAGPVRSLAFSPDSRTLASAGDDTVVRLWDVSSGKLLQALEGHSDVVRGLAFAADGKRLFSAGDDETVRVWNLVPQTAPN